MTIHIAGFPVRVGNHKRQLCAWCGERLIDDDLELMVTPDGDRGEPRHFEPNALIRVEGTNPRYTEVVEHDDGPIPAGWCGDEGRARLKVVSDCESSK